MFRLTGPLSRTEEDEGCHVEPSKDDFGPRIGIGMTTLVEEDEEGPRISFALALALGNVGSVVFPASESRVTRGYVNGVDAVVVIEDIEDAMSDDGWARSAEGNDVDVELARIGKIRTGDGDGGRGRGDPGPPGVGVGVGSDGGGLGVRRTSSGSVDSGRGKNWVGVKMSIRGVDGFEFDEA